MHEGLRPENTKNADLKNTELLNRAFRDGDRDAGDEVLVRLFPQLRELARSHLHSLRNTQALQPTALVSEAIVKLLKVDVEFQDTNHFLCFCSRAMRTIVVDYVRRHGRQRRRPPGKREELEIALDQYSELQIDPLVIHEALSWIGTIDPALERIVELRHFGGLSMEETAEVMALSLRTAERRWRLACAMLRRFLAR